MRALATAFGREILTFEEYLPISFGVALFC
jgi:hypothetical protein